MGVIRTDKWLEVDLNKPLSICKRLVPYFKRQSVHDIYNQLMHFGMYKPSSTARENFELMKKNDVWKRVNILYRRYQKKWGGPEIPIFLFPLGRSGGLFIRREERNKAGVSFSDKMFLFLSDYDDNKEIEALFVHEYHHVCRLNKLNKKTEDYNLLDSIIIEGLAEYTVQRNCGEKYLADWCQMYSKRELEFFWTEILKNQTDIRKDERKHDELLYGTGRMPKLLGYAVGYYLVDNFYQKHNYSTKLSFSLPAEKYLDE